jgi:hypothetical protein
VPAEPQTKVEVTLDLGGADVEDGLDDDELKKNAASIAKVSRCGFNLYAIRVESA